MPNAQIDFPNCKIHESAYVDLPCAIGDGTVIWHFSHVMSGASLGKACKLGQNVLIGSGVAIGDNVKIQNNVSVYPGVTLEDDVFCGPSMVFTNVINPRSEFTRNSDEHYRKTLVRKGASIGANTTIICGVTIGEYAFIGAGSVVTKDVAPYALMMGNPARQKGWACRCGDPLPEIMGQKTACLACDRQYAIEGKAIKPV